MNRKNFLAILITVLLGMVHFQSTAQFLRCSINIGQVNRYCSGDVVIHINVVTDTAFYTLNFTPATPLGGDSFLVSGYSGVVIGTLTTLTGCTDMVTLTIIPLGAIMDTSTLCDTMMHDLMASSGADSYLWSTGDTTDFIDVNTPGLYWCACFYPACGLVYDTFVVQSGVPYYPPSGGPTFIVHLCMGDTATLFAGTGAYSYHWSMFDRGMLVTLPDTLDHLITDSAGIYSCEVTDYCGNIFYYEYICDRAGCYNLVWPGDAGADGIANMYDFFYIADAYGDTGSARVAASSSWIGQSASDWTSFSWGWTPVNAKHADCDGNGVVDYLDFAPLVANYGLVHMRTGEEGSRADDPLVPNITLHANYDTCGSSTVVNVDILLGDASTPIDSISAIVLEFHFDPTYIDTSSIAINYTGSWLGTIGSNLVSFQKNLFTNARLDMGASKTDHINRSGFGKLATISFVTTDNLSGLAFCPLNIGNYLALTAHADTVLLDAINDTLYLDPNKTTGIEDPSIIDATVATYPNPADHLLTVESSKFAISSLVLVNSIGDEVYRKMVNHRQTQVELNNIDNGIYFLELEINGVKLHKKIEVLK